MRSRYYSPAGRVEILLSRSQVLKRIGETAQAQQGAEQALDLARKSKLPKARADCLMMMADVHDQLGEGEAMRQKILQALDIYRRLGDRDGECGATGMLGIVMVPLEGPLAARPYYEQALAIAQTLGDRHNLLRCLLEMGWILIRTKEYESAKHYLQEGLDLALSEEDLFQEAFGTSCLGEIALHQGHPEEALSLHQRALAIRQQLGDKWFQSINWSWLSKDWEALGDLREARKARERAVAITRAIGISSETAMYLGYQAELCVRLGELGLAFAHCRDALDLCQGIDEKDLHPFLLCQLSSVYFARGDWDAAGAAAHEAYEARSEAPRFPVKAHTALTKARLALTQGDSLLAFGLLQEAEEPVSSSQDRGLLFGLCSAWADVHLEAGDLEAVAKDLERMPHGPPQVSSRDWESCAALFSACVSAKQGDLQEAETAFRKAMDWLQASGRRWEQARAFLRFGRALGKEKGSPWLQNARALFSELGALGWADICAKELSS